AQQLGLPLDGISSFLLIARRLRAAGEAPAAAPFWIVQELPRRGPVAGLYAPDPLVPGGLAELVAPRLFPSAARITPPPALALPECPHLCAHCRLPDDLDQLLDVSRAAAAAGVPAPWRTVVPLYPTSPVGDPG
ncbi:MAG: tRNA (adenosine(37)-N6)-threonylcarbamoyltransferase complex dimerization subunit type 1 TsaB, partial [Synechococcaceae cyanobacterium]|nr:tRNA (adenosine(37)-N6)-threonylcarbamoyltransferase complex dimerization subunit type 1 TsaB [Synechococcaceae cyanobacterium]